MSEELVHRSFVALTPSELPAAQSGIAEWCHQKMRALGRDYRECLANLQVAKRNRWSRGGLVKAVGHFKRQIQYYQKIKLAVQAGYLIVPNFETEVMAVRVGRAKPRQTQETYKSANLLETKPDRLPAGEGRYVDDRQYYKDLSYTEANPKDPSKLRKVELYQPSRYDDEPGFPVIAVKPIVLEATERAMAYRIFDRIGVVTGRKKDPVVVGEILHPSANLRWNRNHQKRVTFFIAWWLSTEDL